MKITITPAQGSPFIITGTLLAEGNDETTISQQTPVDVIQPISATACTVDPDQRPPVCTISLKIAKEHATPGAAEFFYMSHLDSLPAGGSIEFECSEPNGALVGRVTMASGAIAQAQGTYTGCTTIFSYQFTGSVPAIPTTGTGH